MVVDAVVAAVTRALHVLAMAVLVGGPVAIALLLRAGVGLDRLLRFERWAWFAAALIVITGLGNVGNLGEGFPDLGSTRGFAFLLKFTLVLLLLILMAVRTLAVVRLQAQGGRLVHEGWAKLAAWYRWTGLLGGVIAGFGLLLAHGGI